MALTIAKTGVQIGLSGGAIYWSIQQGIWGTTQEGSDAMRRLTTMIVPEQTQTRSEPVAPPVEQEAKKPNKSLIWTGWNKGTKAVFETIRDIPEYAGKASSATGKFVGESLGTSK